MEWKTDLLLVLVLVPVMLLVLAQRLPQPPVVQPCPKPGTFTDTCSRRCVLLPWTSCALPRHPMCCRLSSLSSHPHQVMNEDGLVVMSKGLGIAKVLSKFIQVYCGNSQALVFILNASAEAPSFLKALVRDGMCVCVF